MIIRNTPHVLWRRLESWNQKLGVHRFTAAQWRDDVDANKKANFQIFQCNRHPTHNIMNLCNIPGPAATDIKTYQNISRLANTIIIRILYPAWWSKVATTDHSGSNNPGKYLPHCFSNARRHTIYLHISAASSSCRCINPSRKHCAEGGNLRPRWKTLQRCVHFGRTSVRGWWGAPLSGWDVKKLVVKTLKTHMKKFPPLGLRIGHWFQQAAHAPINDHTKIKISLSSNLGCNDATNPCK